MGLYGALAGRFAEPGSFFEDKFKQPGGTVCNCCYLWSYRTSEHLQLILSANQELRLGRTRGSDQGRAGSFAGQKAEELVFLEEEADGAEDKYGHSQGEKGSPVVLYHDAQNKKV